MSRKLRPLIALLVAVHEVASGCGERLKMPYSSNRLVRATLKNRTRIIGGRESTRGSWPWHALVTFREKLQYQPFFCGGSLISPQHILTAAHCAVEMDPSLSSVSLGSIHAEGGDRRISRIVIHEDYSANMTVNPAQLNDIALIVLAKPVEYSSSIQPVCLPNVSSLDETAGETAFAIGFGAYDVGGKVVPEPHSTLLETAIPLIPRDICSQLWRPLDGGAVKNIDESQLCAGSNGHGTAQGDSGGSLLLPLHDRWFQVGVTSFGINHGDLYMQQDKAPGVYTRVSSFCAWIEQHSDGAASCVSRNDLPDKAASATAIHESATFISTSVSFLILLTMVCDFGC